MNWGHKITLVIILFILGMLAMVFVAFKQTNEMIDTNYYEKELNYQSLIDAAQNLNAISKDNLIMQNENGLLVTIPMSLIVDFKNGQLEFIKIDNQKLDMTLDFKPNTYGLFVIDKSKISMGPYTVRIKWNSNQKEYYREQHLTVQ